MTIHLTFDLRAVILGFVLLIVAAAVATPFAISLADDSTAASPPTAVLGTAFTYQGRIEQDGVPKDGAVNLQFRLWDAAVAGNIIGDFGPNAVAVTNGLFSVQLDFGANAFTGEKRWIETIANSAPLGRMEMTAGPYAVWSGAGPFWNLGGNAGTTAANFIGTTDNAPLELRVNGQRAFSIVPAVPAIPGSAPNMIGGHPANTFNANIVGATIGGGGGQSGDCLVVNRVRDSYGTVGGGCDNKAGEGGTGSAKYATVGGGISNAAVGQQATVGGGNENIASNLGATVAGGFQNQASGFFSTVAGGQHNVASGTGSTILGGSANTAAGAYSFAAGYHAKANSSGVFAWADHSTEADFVENLPNTFNVRATGGVGFQLGLQSPTPWACVVFDGNANWSCSSDRNLKTNFIDMDGNDVLARLADVPILQWTAKDVDGATPHVGPMAQDFYAAFALGDSDKMLSSGDVGGIALAAIKGLHQITKEQDERIAALESQVASLSVAVATGSDAGSSAATDPRIDAIAAELAALRDMPRDDGTSGLPFAAIAIGLLGAGFGLGTLWGQRTA